MKIKITEPTRCGGKGVAIGQEVDASEKDAKYLIQIGKAKLIDKPKKEKKGGLTTKSGI